MKEVQDNMDAILEMTKAFEKKVTELLESDHVPVVVNLMNFEASATIFSYTNSSEIMASALMQSFLAELKPKKGEIH